jgi:hypothetical protein
MRMPPWPGVGARVARPRVVTSGLRRLGGGGGRSPGCPLLDWMSPGEEARQGQATVEGMARRSPLIQESRSRDMLQISEISVKS